MPEQDCCLGKRAVLQFYLRRELQPLFEQFISVCFHYGCGTGTKWFLILSDNEQKT